MICNALIGLVMFVNYHNDPAALVPPGATTAEVRALPGLPGSGTVDAFAFINGLALVIVDGNAYWQNPSTCAWIFYENIYDPSFYQYTFYMVNDQWYHRYNTGVSLPISTEFSEDFESGATVGDLLPPNASRFTWIVLLSPLAPNVPAYNALGACLRAGTCDFLDNRLDFVSTVVHSGQKSLRFYAVPPSPESLTSKSLLDRGLVIFRKGDDAWYSGWYYAEGDLPFTLLDFETSGINGRPGFRITLRNGALGAELKWLDKPTYLQDPGSMVTFPSGQWVNVRVHVLFSEDEFGKVEIWQDGVRVLSQQGRTLPTADSVIDYLQVGITATPRETVLYVDDIHLSATPKFSAIIRKSLPHR